MSFKGERVLCVVAHPDDETIGCGATLARAAREGAEVHVVLPFRRMGLPGRGDWDTTAAQFSRAAGALGATAVLPPSAAVESEFWQAPHRVVDLLAGHLDWATMVFTHWPADMHQSHRVVAQAVEIGTRPFRLQRCVLQCEIASSTDQSYASSFSPNLFVPVSAADALCKLQAMRCYPGEYAPGRNPAALERGMQMRGEQVGGELAEAFAVARWFL